MSLIYCKGVMCSRLMPQPRGVDNGYVNLAIGIVQTACDDYRALKRAYAREWNERERSILKSRMHEIELFFKSELGDICSFGKADYILKILEAGG